MRTSLRPYLDLVRLPNLFTAMADPLAGYLYVGGGAEGIGAVLRLMAASACLYGGGVVLNDIGDVAQDRRERPHRPLPAGMVTVRAAGLLTAALLALGVSLAASLSSRSLLLAVSLVASIVLYDVAFRATMMAPLFMGLCRAINLTLGMGLAGGPIDSTLLVPAALMWLYVTSITHFARKEATVNSRARLLAGTMGTCAAVVGLTGVSLIAPAVHWGYLGVAGGLAVFLGYHGLQAARAQDGGTVQGAVKRFVIGLILFDAALAWATRGPLAASLVFALLGPTLWFGRRLRVT